MRLAACSCSRFTYGPCTFSGSLFCCPWPLSSCSRTTCTGL
jgi:hypothetical protein